MTRFISSLSRPAQTSLSLAVFGLLSLGQPSLAASVRPGSTAIPQAPKATRVADDGVIVRDAWARASAGAASTGAAYVTLMGGSLADSLVGVSTPIAATADVHVTTEDNGVMKMRPVPAVPIAPGQTVTFAPGGTHIMLMGLKKPLTAGQSFPLTLTFTRSGAVTLDVQVRAMGHGAPMGGQDHMN